MQNCGRSPCEIAEHLGVSRDTVHNWIKQRGMSATRIGRFCKCKPEAAAAWVAQADPGFGMVHHAEGGEER